jgi:hypothetical protein
VQHLLSPQAGITIIIATTTTATPKNPDVKNGSGPRHGSESVKLRSHTFLCTFERSI